jgi:O-antigen/teichoic acid export membrane protein
MRAISTIISNLKNQDIRSKTSIKNSAVMLIIKGISIIISLLYVPLLIGQLDSVNYGIWLTLTSIVSWCSFLDIGLGHGLRNNLAKAIAENNTVLAKRFVATSYFLLACIVLLAGIIVVIVFPVFNWSNILNAPQSLNRDLTILTIVTIVCFLATFVLRLINSILFAIQKPALSSLVEVSSQFVAFLIVVIMAHSGFKWSLLQYGCVISIIPVVVVFIYTFILFSTKLKTLSFKVKDIDLKLSNNLFNLGFKFLIIQITAILLFQTNNFILAHVVGPEAVTEYNISYKYIGIISMIFSIINAPLWSATTDAYFRKDFRWIVSTLTKMKKVFFCFVSLGIFAVVVSGIVYKIWLSNKVESDYFLQILILCYYTLSMWCGIHCSIINGTGKVKLQFYFTSIEALCHIPLAILLGKLLGIYGVIMSMILMTSINAIWEPIQVKKILNNETKGIWNL